MIRSQINDGYATMWPLRYYPSRMIACAAVGARAESWRMAHGFALVSRGGSGKPTPRRLNTSATIRTARRHAALRLEHGAAVDIYRAMAVGSYDRILWQRVETIDEIDYPSRHDWYVGLDGVRKAVGGADVESVAINELSDALSAVRNKWSNKEMHRFLDMLEGVDWANTTEVRRVEIFAGAATAFQQADIQKLVTEWGATSAEHTVPFAEMTRSRMRAALFPQISSTLSQVDAAAANAVGEQSGLFIRNELGREMTSLTAHGRSIVEQGLRDGLGRGEIAADLRREIPEIWKKYGENYSRVVASNAMVRARSISQAGSYRDAGVEKFEILAVMDERTTSVCTELNGQIITVRNASAISTAAAAAQSVNELKEANPFIQDMIDPTTGRRVLRTTLGVDIAYAEDGGRDFTRVLSNDELATGASIGFPPYHFSALSDDSLITTCAGNIPIQDVRLGMKVRTHRNRFRNVYATMSKRGSGLILRIETDTGRIVLISEEHPVLTARGWKPAGHIEPGDVLFECGEHLSGVFNKSDLGNPEDFPSLFDEESVPWDVVKLPVLVPMVLPIDFDNDHVVGKRKINNVFPDRPLSLEGNVGCFENENHEFFADGEFVLPRFGHRPCAFSGDIGTQDGVVLGHPFGRSAAPVARFLSKPVGPMVFPARPLNVGRRVGYGDLLHSRSEFNPVPLAPEIQLRDCNAERALNMPDGLLPLPVPCFDESLDGPFVSEINHKTSWIGATVITIAEVDYNGKLHNLAVEDDETYVADGIIVHNCRTTTVMAM